MLLALLNAVLTLAVIGGFFWGLQTLGQLRRGQAKLQGELDRIAKALGIPPRSDQAEIRCENCGAQYSAFLTGCNQCGRAKSKNAVPFFPGRPAQETPSAMSTDRAG
jgi:hypothetical protein